MNLGGSTAIGPREANEDNYFFLDFSDVTSFPNGAEAFILVSDGMGGYQGGDVASSIVVDQAAGYLKQLLDMARQDPIDLDACAALVEIVDRAHTAILDEAKHLGRSMGATFVGAFISETHAWIGHVGDSRAYLIRNNEAIQLTEDHSQVGRMLARGLITEEEAQNHPERNKIEQALGFTVKETTIDEIDLLPGDVILLCSDGVYTKLGNEKLASIVRSEKDAMCASEKVIKAAISAGTDDNSTVVLAFPSRQSAKKRMGTISEIDRRKPISPHPWHGKLSSASGKRYRRARKPYYYNSTSSRARTASTRSFKSVLILVVTGLILLGTIIAVTLNAFSSGKGKRVANMTEQDAAVKPVEGPVTSSTNEADAVDTETTDNESQSEVPPDASIPLKSSKLVYYIDINHQIREFSKDNGLKSPDLILAQGKSVLVSNDTISDEGKQYIYLDGSYTTDLLNDVRLYESGERTFNSGFAQLFDSNSYLKTIKGISSFFASGKRYTIEDEVTHLIILADSSQSIMPEDETTDSSANEDKLAGNQASQEAAQPQTQQNDKP